jgi:hypothetical protein
MLEASTRARDGFSQAPFSAADVLGVAVCLHISADVTISERTAAASRCHGAHSTSQCTCRMTCYSEPGTRADSLQRAFCVHYAAAQDSGRVLLLARFKLRRNAIPARLYDAAVSQCS